METSRAESRSLELAAAARLAEAARRLGGVEALARTWPAWPEFVRGPLTAAFALGERGLRGSPWTWPALALGPEPEASRPERSLRWALGSPWRAAAWRPGLPGTPSPRPGGPRSRRPGRPQLGAGPAGPGDPPRPSRGGGPGPGPPAWLASGPPPSGRPAWRWPPGSARVPKAPRGPGRPDPCSGLGPPLGLPAAGRGLPGAGSGPLRPAPGQGLGTHRRPAPGGGLAALRGGLLLAAATRPKDAGCGLAVRPPAAPRGARGHWVRAPAIPCGSWPLVGRPVLDLPWSPPAWQSPAHRRPPGRQAPGAGLVGRDHRPAARRRVATGDASGFSSPAGAMRRAGRGRAGAAGTGRARPRPWVAFPRLP